MSQAGSPKAPGSADPPPQPRGLVWANACEVDNEGGCLTIRAGSLGDVPLLLAMPANAFPTLIDNLQAASVEAEEEYWDTAGALVESAGDGASPELVNDIVSRWLLAENWPIDDVPALDGEIFLVIHKGFVGLGVDPPFVQNPSVVIFDPMQLRRLEPALRDAMTRASSSSPTGWSPQAVTGTLRILAEKPWPGLGRLDPTVEEARAEMRARRIAFRFQRGGPRPGR